jgi:hypothetical protein
LRFRKHKVIRGKKQIFAYQDGSFCKYMTPGVFPKRDGHGTAVRALFDLEECHHQALLCYVNKCETLAMKSMSKEVTGGLNKAKLIFPYPTFPGRGTGYPNRQIFSSIATAHKECLNSHTDNDAIYGVVTNSDYAMDKQGVDGSRLQISFEVDDGHFHEMSGSSSFFRPDAVVGLNAGIRNDGDWEKTILDLFWDRTPFCSLGVRSSTTLGP